MAGADDSEDVVARATTLLRDTALGSDPAVAAMQRTIAASIQPVPRAPLPPIAIGEGSGSATDLVVVKPLGEGGMGVVQLARQASLARDVAVKRPRPGALDAGEVAALLAEAVTTGSLEHPNIVPIHALGLDPEGRPLLVMKRVEGVSLRTLALDPQHPRWSAVSGDRTTFYVELAIRVCDALAFAHRHGVVHRDVKPDNVMIGEYGEVYLLDWGIAIRGDSPSRGIAGTPAYMAPEMLRMGDAPIDARTDVYLLGATLHECLTGRPPHAGKTIEAVLLSIARSEPHRYDGSVPPELAALLGRAMHRDPAERPASASELRALLADHLRHREAVAIATAAAARLGELEGLAAESGPDAVAVHAAFHAARFGFEQSLRSWPENASAQTGLRSALVAMARWEITQRNRGAAAALIAAIESPPADLVQALAALDRALSADAAERDRLARIERDLDPTVSRRERLRVARIAGAAHIVAACALIAVNGAGLLEFAGHWLLGGSIAAVCVAAVGTYLGRRHFLSNRVNRQITFGVLVLLVALAIERGAGVIAGRTLGEMAADDLVLAATGAGLAALAIRRFYAVPALVLAGSAVLAALHPEHGLNLALAASVLCVLAVLLFPGVADRPFIDS